MKRTFVCIIDQEEIINYLFLKEVLSYGDEILLIAPKRFSYEATAFSNLYKDSYEVDCIILNNNGDEIIWDTICRTLKERLNHDTQYYVNLSGGSRLMSIAVQQVFEGFNALFFFIPFDRNVIVHSQIDDENDNNDDVFYPIKHKVSVEEFLIINGLTYKAKKPSQTFEYTRHYCQLFTEGMFSQQEYNILDELRDLRDCYVNLNNKDKFPLADDVKSFLEFVKFKSKHPNKLSPTEIQYLTGNWFEEYLYYTIKAVVKPDTIALGVEIRKKGGETCNDIDIAFTLNNQLHAIECKTGVGKRSLFNQMVYKACALNEALLGIQIGRAHV